MEEVLIKDIGHNKFNYISFYYDHESKPEELQFSDFNKNEWLLTKGLDMTPDDITIMEKFKNLLLNLMEECNTQMAKYNFLTKECRLEKKRLERVMIA